MSKTLILALLLACVLARIGQTNDQDALTAFKQFKKTYNKRYSSEEHNDARFAIFKENLRRIAILNNSDSATHGVTQFSDLTELEFEQIYLGYKPSLRAAQAKYSVTELPTSDKVAIDWSTLGAVTPVKNQGSCGSCWAFSTTGSIEGQYVVQLKENLTSFSEQQLVDCDTTENEGCNGGLMDNAFEYLENASLETEGSYPYKGVDGKCQYNSSLGLTSVASYVDVSTDENVIAATLSNVGPLSVALNANNLQFYVSGVSNPLFCNPKGLNHGVLIVGYGKQDGKDYWKVKNSWGTSWGEKGYFKIIKGKGKCGINTAVSYPILA